MRLFIYLRRIEFCGHFFMESVVNVQPPLAEIAKREDFSSFPVVPSEFIRNHKSTYSGQLQRKQHAH